MSKLGLQLLPSTSSRLRTFFQPILNQTPSFHLAYPAQCNSLLNPLKSSHQLNDPHNLHLLARRCCTYKSVYGLDMIHPGSSPADISLDLQHTLVKQYSNETRDKFSGFIPIQALQIRSMRGSGPGGQSVNKSNSKVEVRFNVQEADWIPLWIKKKFTENQKHRINKDNEFIISSEKTRTMLLNQADCMDRIRHYIREAELQATPPPPPSAEEVALSKKRERKANERRLLDKRVKAFSKGGRGALWCGKGGNVILK